MYSLDVYSIRSRNVVLVLQILRGTLKGSTTPVTVSHFSNTNLALLYSFHKSDHSAEESVECIVWKRLSKISNRLSQPPVQAFVLYLGGSLVSSKTKKWDKMVGNSVAVAANQQKHVMLFSAFSIVSIEVCRVFFFFFNNNTCWWIDSIDTNSGRPFHVRWNFGIL